MRKPDNLKEHRAEREHVLTKAVLNLAAQYELKGKDLSDIIGISEASVSRLNQGTKFISEKTKEGELALLLIRLYKSLTALVGNDPAKAKSWLMSFNHYFAESPFDHIKHIDGLVAVVHYLDAMRGKI